MRAALPDLAALAGSWMVLAILITLMLTLTALLLDRVARDTIPSRFIWGAALFGSVTLVMSLPFRVDETHGARMPSPVSDESALDATAQLPVDVPPAVREPSSIATTIASTVAQAIHDGPRWLHTLLVVGWPLASIVLAAFSILLYKRHLRYAAALPRARVGPIEVALSTDLGPMVVGVLNPCIVVPAWLHERPLDEQQLVIRHERAHIAAGDPLLLLGACAAVVVMPWNPMVWMLYSRLQLAIEVDCDARVLADATSPRPYGELLISLCERPTVRPMHPLSPAFANHHTHLERRLDSMTRPAATHRVPRRITVLALGCVSVLAACSGELPSSAELQGLDVAGTESRVASALPKVTEKQFFVNGKATTADEAKAVPASRIATIEVKKAQGNRAEFHITTLEAPVSSASAPDERDASAILQARRMVGGANTELRADKPALRGKSTEPFAGLLFVDGVKTDPAQLSKIAASSILSVEVVKGAAAEKAYGAEGAKGAILITTKKP